MCSGSFFIEDNTCSMFNVSPPISQRNLNIQKLSMKSNLLVPCKLSSKTTELESRICFVNDVKNYEFNHKEKFSKLFKFPQHVKMQKSSKSTLMQTHTRHFHFSYGNDSVSIKEAQNNFPSPCAKNSGLSCCLQPRKK